ncbi:LAMI_0C09934g1_1 [Lachancea mirantina]|uniref:LAMI_0C09934g1_1 n=1 Tax=Lachancea mirantina TaxID=1230905 RepID=A0A1G4J5S0_9SACH|nr:LAMI_0C09934g1_1 [Lachancea mirantina]
MGKAASNTSHAVQAGDKAIIVSTWQHKVIDILPLNKFGGVCSFNGVKDGEVPLNDRYLNKVAVVENGNFKELRDVVVTRQE